MAVKYWYVAGNGSAAWSVAGNWYNGSGGTGGVAGVPTTADDAIVNAASGSGTLAINGTSTCASLNASSFIGTLSGSQALNIVSSATTGATVLSLGGTHNYTGTITISGSANNGIVLGNGRTHLGAVIINSSALRLLFNDLFACTGIFTLTAGYTSGSSISLGTMSLSNSNIRTFSFTNLYLAGSGTTLSVATQTNLTWSVVNIYLTNTTGTAKSISLSNLVACNNLYLQGSGASATTITIGVSAVIRPNVYIEKLDGTLLLGTSTLNSLYFVEGTTVTWIGTNTINIRGDLYLCNSVISNIACSLEFSGGSVSKFYTFNKQLGSPTIRATNAELNVFGDYISTSTSTSSIVISSNISTYSTLQFHGNVSVLGNVICDYADCLFFGDVLAQNISAANYGGYYFDARYLDNSKSNTSLANVSIPYGRFTSNNCTITISGSFVASGANSPKEIDFGNSIINLTGTGGVFSITSTNTSFYPNTSTINIINPSNASVTFTCGTDLTHNRLVINRGTAGATTIINTRAYFNEFINLTPFASTILFDSGQPFYFYKPPEIGNWNGQTTISSTSTSNATFYYAGSGGDVILNNVLVADISASSLYTGRPFYAINSASNGDAPGWVFNTMPARTLGSQGAG